jgi:hypothetical protein
LAGQMWNKCSSLASGPQCFWDHRTAPFESLHSTMINFFRQYQDLPLVSQSILFLHTNTNSCICVDNIKIEQRKSGQRNYCSWHTVNVVVHNTAPQIQLNVRSS